MRLGKYQLLERLGMGGMAEVWKARVVGPGGFQRTVVVKRILPHFVADPAFVEMFTSEARLSARLTHANIVQVFEFGEDRGEHFLAMEFVHGRDLVSLIREQRKRGPMPPGLAAYVVRDICRALQYAHALADDDGRPLRIIHRDVSPSNVMLGFDGAVKLLDFGIAKALAESDGRTATGTLKGKFGYMAPELVEGLEIDHRADLFAAGVVLHEALTGRRLFKGASDLQTIANVKAGRVDPPSKLNPSVEPDLDAICLKALGHDRDGRYQTGHELAIALDEIVHRLRWGAEPTSALMAELFPEPSTTGRNSELTRPGRFSGATALLSRMNLAAIRRAPTPWLVAGGALALVAATAVVVAHGRAAPAPVESAPAPVIAVVPSPAASQVVTVRVTSAPPGAEVRVLGEDEPRGRTPLEFTLPLGGGALRISVSAAGHEPALAEVGDRADTQLQLALLPIPVEPSRRTTRRKPPPPKITAGELADPFRRQQKRKPVAATH